MIDWPPWVQTVATVLGVLCFLLVIGLIVAAEVGRALVRENPESAIGARLVVIGIGVRAAVRSKPAQALLASAPAVRELLNSLTESDPPPNGGAS